MARTMKLPKQGASINAKEGWQNLKITHAEYGSWNGKTYLDVNFEGLPETLNLRVYEAHSKDGDEFAIGNLFRYANAGIESVLTSDSGDKILKINDNPKMLIGKTIKCFLYKDGRYFRILNRVVPAEPFENAAESFDEMHIEYIQAAAEKSFVEYVEPRLKSESPKEARTSSW